MQANFDAELERLQTLLHEKQDALRALEARRAALNITQSAGYREPNSSAKSLLNNDKAPTPTTKTEKKEDEAVIVNEGKDYITNLPDLALGIIMRNLDLNSRGRMSQVNQRMNRILESGYYGLDNVVVVNLFEEKVWNENVTKSKIQCRPLTCANHLEKILMHIGGCSSLKLWFRTIGFVRQVVDILQQNPFKFKCLDVYPYGSDVALDTILSHLPDIGSITLRPHGSDYFWEGLRITNFPNFNQLETLVLDSINLDTSAALPPSLNQLEWCNRREQRFAEFLPVLKQLKSLEYLLLGHVNFNEPGIWSEFVSAVNEHMPTLQFLVLRFVRFPQKMEHWDTSSCPNPQPFKGLKVVKLDLCYGDLAIIVRAFLDLTAKETLKILSLNCIYEDLQLKGLYSVLSELHHRQISLQLGLLQKGPRKSKEKSCAKDEKGEVLYPPLILKDVLWKIDMSFLDDPDLLSAILSTGTYWQLSELKFVQCEAVSDDMLKLIAQKCPRVRKILLSKCDNVTNEGINAFIRDWSLRRANHLHVVWRNKEHPACYYIDLLKDKTGLLDELRSRFVTKDLPGDNTGERVVIWDRNAPDEEKKKKTLVIQDYGEQEMCGILGFAVPSSSEEPLEDTVREENTE